MGLSFSIWSVPSQVAYCAGSRSNRKPVLHRWRLIRLPIRFLRHVHLRNRHIPVRQNSQQIPRRDKCHQALQRRGTPQRFLFLTAVIAFTRLLFGAENRERISLAVAGYFGYECSPVYVEWAHNMVAQFRNYRALFIFQRGDFVCVSVFEVNCDRHGFAYLESSLLLRRCGTREVLDDLLHVEEGCSDRTPTSVRSLLRLRCIGVGGKTCDDHTLVVMKDECLAIHAAHSSGCLDYLLSLRRQLYKPLVIISSCSLDQWDRYSHQG
jgi:hypothetical protein